MQTVYNYLLTTDAEQEYIHSFLWYEQQQTGLGEKFVSSIRNKLQRISANPHQYKKMRDHFYEAPLIRSFPFVIIYFIDTKKNLIIVTSIFHTKRNPRKKYKK